MNVPYVPSQNEDMTVEFQHLGIQCVRRKDIGEALKQREQIRVDPYRQGFDHMNSTQAVDLNAVRLCFQVIFGPAVIQVFFCSSNIELFVPGLPGKSHKPWQVYSATSSHLFKTYI